MQVLIFSQRLRTSDKPYVKLLLEVLDQHNIQYALYKPFKEMLKAEGVVTEETLLIDSFESLKEHAFDFVFSLGGDGTILQAVTLIRSLGIPIVGINLGRLGFLATIEKSKISEAVQQILDKKYRIEKRSMIELASDNNLFGPINFALNDFTIHKRDDSSMIIIHTYINGQFLNSYWADGLVVSTPTGSTGYNLSGGGPIVFPQSSNFAITPLAPHNLNVRPIVISDSDTLSFKIDGRDRNYLVTLDSRAEKITADQTLVVRKCSWHAHIVCLESVTFIKTIHDKLYWGLDSRN